MISSAHFAACRCCTTAGGAWNLIPIAWLGQQLRTGGNTIDDATLALTTTLMLRGGVLLSRLSVEAQGGSIEQVEQTERRAGRIVAWALVGLCLYVLAAAVYGLIRWDGGGRSTLRNGIRKPALLDALSRFSLRQSGGAVCALSAEEPLPHHALASQAVSTIVTECRD